jgi:hypothetical protein
MRTLIAAGAIAALAAAAPAFADSKNQDHKKATAPSRNDLASAPPVTATGATPFAWIDDASVLPPGMMSMSISAMRWHNGDSSEADVPIVDAAFGLSRRVQFSASVPRVVGGADAAGGMGTSFFSAKIALVDDPRRSFKVAAAPTLQIVSEGVAATLPAGATRGRWGMPASAEVAVGPARLYGGGGYFSPGLWFAGGAAAARASDKVVVSVGFSRAWRHDDLAAPPTLRARNELSGGAAYALTPTVSLFGTLGRTVATLDENGAGATVAGGLSVAFAAGR